MMTAPKISASMLGADPTCLGAQLQAAIKAGVDRIHWDCMDGHFVPNLAFGPAVIKACRPLTKQPFDVHLMLAEPAQFIDMFIDAGADSLIIHPEATPGWPKLLETIRTRGIHAGIALKPQTSVSIIESSLSLIDSVVVMTVEPGFGGQAFMKDQLPKIQNLRKLGGSNLQIHIDGGINSDTASLAVQAGADVLVAGTALFHSPDYAKTVVDLKGH